MASTAPTTIDNWRKAQIAAGSRNSMMAIIANAHRFSDQSEAEWARVCLTNFDRLRELNGHDNDVEIDAWHMGYFAGRRDESVTDDPNFAAGWFAGRCDALYRCDDPHPRPEGYYHSQIEQEVA